MAAIWQISAGSGGSEIASALDRRTVRELSASARHQSPQLIKICLCSSSSRRGNKRRRVSDADRIFQPRGNHRAAFRVPSIKCWRRKLGYASAHKYYARWRWPYASRKRQA